ncbi:hypothetical protein G2W53_024915 [Senna tora]|uniref:Uncharacterized protein n=1 Tax=Senna tora TaxID=362788 RepID=A0A834TE47_9FABA|nr:hypothetical protein G2W53_024915 [Senna tora]
MTESFSLILARLTKRFRSALGSLSILFLRNSLGAGCLSSKCHSQSEYLESGKIFGSPHSLRMLAPTSVVDLTSLVRVEALGASVGPPPLDSFFALTVAKVRWHEQIKKNSGQEYEDINVNKPDCIFISSHSMVNCV